MSRPKSIEELAKALSVSESQLKGLRRKYRMDHGQEGENELEKWLKHVYTETRDTDYFLRAGALPSELGSRATNPRPPALGRGRTGTKREPGEARRRHLKKVVKPPTAAQIEQASEQSAYVEFRDTLDAGGVPRDYQNVLDERARAVFEVLKGEELARRAARARAERLRQAELALRQQGKSPDEYLKAVEAAVEAMRAEARAA